MSNVQTWKVPMEYLRLRHDVCRERLELRHYENRGLCAYCDKCKRFVRVNAEKASLHAYPEGKIWPSEIILSVED